MAHLSVRPPRWLRPNDTRDINFTARQRIPSSWAGLLCIGTPRKGCLFVDLSPGSAGMSWSGVALSDLRTFPDD